MKLAIDLQSCQTDSRDRGIGRYSMSLAVHMANAKSEDVTILLDGCDVSRMLYTRGHLRRCGVDVETATYAYPNTAQFTEACQPLARAAGLLKSRLAESVGPDVLLVMSFFEEGRYSTAYNWQVIPHLPKAVIAYDLIPLLFPDKYLPPGHIHSDWYRKKLERFKEFDLYLAISQATQNDLIEHLGISPEKITVIGAGLEQTLKADCRERSVQDTVLAALGITKPYVLVVGNADWRKNSMGALEAFAALPKQTRRLHQLVFTRVGQDVHDALDGRYASLRNEVIIAGAVNEQTLGLLYTRCQLFFFPSYYEGFGLPVLEAMALGAPVLSSSFGGLTEVVHDPQVLFDPWDKQGTTRALRRALEDTDFRESVLKGGVQHAQTFSWCKCAEAAFAALRTLVSEKNKKVLPSPWKPSEFEIITMADAIDSDLANETALISGLEAIRASTRRRILIDITEVNRVDARSGIQRVVRNYCAGLIEYAQRSDAFHVEPFIWTEDGFRYARSYARDVLGLDCTGADDVLSVGRNDLLFMVDSSWWNPDRFEPLYRDVRSMGGEVVWVVYDLVPHLTPEFCDPGMPPVFKEWLSHVASNADGCLCISHATRSDLEAYFDEAIPDEESRPWTRTVHLGSDFERGRRFQESEEVRNLVEGIRGAPLFVALGTVEPRKDYPTILRAFETLWEDGSEVTLIIIGKEGWNVRKFAAELRSHAEYGHRLYWLESLSDDDVIFLLANATALIQASIAEGYGLPVAEAGSLGTPLVLSDIPVFREIAADEAFYFPPQNGQALAGLLSRSLASGSWKSPKAVRLMSWSESSEKLSMMLCKCDGMRE